jgi:phosphatidylglycerol:prolipoprotein diacylglycerol transferase
MSPFLDIFGFTIPGYGAFAGLAVLSSYGLAWFLGGKTRLGSDHATTIYLLAACGALIGSRVLQVIVERDRFAGNLVAGLLRPEGGIWYGALIGSIVMTIIFARAKKLSPLLALDVMAPAWAIAHSVGRVGCYLGGCCFGTPHEGSLAVVFPKNSAAYQELANHNGGVYVNEVGTTPLFPVQLFEAAGEAVLVVVLIALLLRGLKDGAVIFTYLGAYAVLRFVLEWWRFDPVRGWVIEDLLSTSQLIAVLMATGALVSWIYVRKKAPAVV